MQRTLPPAPPLTRIRRDVLESAALPVRLRSSSAATPRNTRPRVIAIPAAFNSPLAMRRTDDSDTESPGGVTSVQMVNVQNVANAVTVSADPAVVSAAVQAVHSADQSQRQAQQIATEAVIYAGHTAAAADAAIGERTREIETQANRHVQAQFERAEERVAQVQLDA